MKKLILAAVATLVLVACNKEVGPEYSVAPVVSSVVSTPIAPTTDTDINVTAKVTSQYGLTMIWIHFWPVGDESKAQSTTPFYCRGESDTMVSFKGKIPKQKAGKYIYVVGAQSAMPYGVIGSSEPHEFTVTEAIVELPDPE